ncbi:hypothetical protein [Kitasatospora sp. NPDC059088]|uniref:hypothetical protein n=1 Tax=unclassified Kitasatospora TaxID=2633591 RepID=UPI00368A99F8
MAVTATTDLLRYTLTTSPPDLVRATAGHPRQARLEIAVTRNPAADGVPDCRSITVEVPIGDGADALTARAERIDTAYRAPHGRGWHIRATTPEPGRTVFTCTPEGPRGKAGFDDREDFTLVLERIPLTGPPGTVQLRISDETATGSGAYARRSTVLPVAVVGE